MAKSLLPNEFIWTMLNLNAYHLVCVLICFIGFSWPRESPLLMVMSLTAPMGALLRMEASIHTSGSIAKYVY